MMDLAFAPSEEDDLLNTTVRNSETGSVVYTIETPKFAEGALTTTVNRLSQLDGSTRFAFKILWNGVRRSLEDVTVVLDHNTLEEVPARDVLERAHGSAT